jgi:oxaloacetate decarboxylase beta subunit
MIQGLQDFVTTTGFQFVTWKMLIMWAVAGLLIYLAVAKGFEPLLLIPIAFGALIANLPTRGVITIEQRANGTTESAIFRIEAVDTASRGEVTPPTAASTGTHTLKVHRVEGGLYDFISQGV